MRRLGDLLSGKKCKQGEGFVKFCVKKVCVGDGGELERALDDVFGIQVLVRSRCKSCSIPNGKLLPSPPLVFSYRLFIFSNRENFQVGTWVWRKFAAENRVNFQRGIRQESNVAANQEKQIFLLCQISPSASSTRDLGTRSMKLLQPVFSSLHSRIKIFVFAVNSKSQFSIFVWFI